MSLLSKTKAEIEYLFEQIVELAAVRTSFKECQNLLNLSRYEAEEILKENGFDSYKTVLAKESAKSKKKAKEVMFNSVLNAPDPSLGNPTMAKELLKLHEQSDASFIRIQGHSVNIADIKGISKTPEYNDFRNMYDYHIVLLGANIRLRYENESDCENDFNQLNKLLNER